MIVISHYTSQLNMCINDYGILTVHILDITNDQTQYIGSFNEATPRVLKAECLKRNIVSVINCVQLFAFVLFSWMNSRWKISSDLVIYLCLLHACNYAVCNAYFEGDMSRRLIASVTTLVRDVLLTQRAFIRCKILDQCNLRTTRVYSRHYEYATVVSARVNKYVINEKSVSTGEPIIHVSISVCHVRNILTIRCRQTNDL